MSNYIILNNFSVDFCQPAITEWAKKKDVILEYLKNKDKGVIEKSNITEFKLDHFVNLRKYPKLYHLSVARTSLLDNSTAQILKNIQGFKGISFFVSLPGKVDNFHIDTERSCAINFPIDIDTERSQFRIGLSNVVESYTLWEEKEIPKWQEKYYDKKGKGTFLLEDNEYETYSLEKPVIFNAKVPHGGANFADTVRVIGSIGFNDTIENILPQIEDWL